MKVAILGRSSMLLNTARLLIQSGHEIVFVGTMKPAEYYNVGYEEFEQFAVSVGATYKQGGNINDEEYIAALKGCEAEIAVSVNWPTIIGNGPIDVFQHGILNAHAGDLPRYRGNACPNWAILNGEEKVGLCVHKMEAGELDSGDILAKAFFNVSNDTYIGEIYEWLEREIPSLFELVVTGLAENTLVPEKQSDEASNILRCYPRREEDSRIDWNKGIDEILRLIRASSFPFSGAITSLEGEHELRVWKAVPYKHHGNYFAMAGQVMMKINDNPVIACGDAAIELLEVTMNGNDASRLILSSLRNRLI